MRKLTLVLLLSTGACASAGSIRAPTPPEVSDDLGVLVMAHGGSHEWNATVSQAVAPLAAVVPTTIAYGMADPLTLAAGLDSLASRGVSRVAVVRLFVSGQSFRDQTAYFLGLSPTPPGSFVLMGRSQYASRRPLEHGLTVTTHQHGLMASTEARQIIVERALGASDHAPSESVLLLAHGMGDDQENSRVLDAMAAIGRDLEWVGFAAVKVETLREDWAEKRQSAEEEIRAFVAGETDAGRRVIVVPMRLTGFGPYAEVLAGLDYVASEGLLPHPRVTEWIRRTAADLFCEQGWSSPVDRCGTTVESDTTTAH